MFRTTKINVFTSAIVQITGWLWVVWLQKNDPLSEWAFLGLSLVLGAAVWLMWLEGMWAPKPFEERFLRGMAVSALMGACMISGMLIGQWFGTW